MGSTTIKPPWLRTVVPPFREAIRETPTRPASLESEVWVPLMQAVLTGVLVGMPVGIGLALWREWPWWAVAPMAVSVMALVWMRRLVAHGKLLMTVERMTGIDFNRDGQVGQPKVQLEGTITDKRGDRNTIWRVTFPGELRHLRRFAAAVNCGSANFSERDAIICGYTNFEGLRDLFILNGWASWRNQRAHQQGVELTMAGETIIEQITRTPLPREREVV